MTPDDDHQAAVKTPLAPDVGALDERSRRAWIEPMAVRRLPDGRYAVDSRSGATYIVDLPVRDCSCPDHEIRGTLCKHLRRVAIEINQGHVPPPEREVRCRVCGRRTTFDHRVGTPSLCEDCRLEPGDLVFDREREANVPLLVIAVSDRRADEVEISELDRTVASYETNRGYDPADPVVEAVYPLSVRTDRAPRRYAFPISRLVKPDDTSTQTTLSESMAGH